MDRVGKLTSISGLEIFPVKKLENEKGKLFHVMRSDLPFFEKFGEVYISVTNPNVIKGWKFHEILRQNFVVPVGEVKFVFFDNRPDSPTKGSICELITGEDNYYLIKVPEQIWYGFKTISDKPSYIVNCATHPHDPAESKLIDLEDDLIPYKWN